jgi:hypothetical protein
MDALCNQPLRYALCGTWWMRVSAPTRSTPGVGCPVPALVVRICTW